MQVHDSGADPIYLGATFRDDGGGGPVTTTAIAALAGALEGDIPPGALVRVQWVDGTTSRGSLVAVDMAAGEFLLRQLLPHGEGVYRYPLDTVADVSGI